MSSPRLSVCLSFDFDAMSVWIGSLQSNSPAQISRGEFGAFAIPRLLDLLRRRSARATFFVPGHTALAYPELVKRIADEGHEIGHHGWVHENPALLDRDAEREVMERGFEALDRAAGVRPVGYRSPGADFSANTIDILLEYGIRYDTSCSATDFTPYYLRKGDRWSTTEPYVFGETTDLVEIPFSWGLDDFPHFEFTPGWSSEQSPASAVREIWQAEFDWAYANVPGGVYDLCMHPQVIGRAHRLTMLEGLVEHMQAHEGVAFEPLGQYAERWRSENPVREWLASSPIQAARQTPVGA
jgi:peptidoglycan/xylan/chitin deacetylase (PgdA/CDA1 family)